MISRIYFSIFAVVFLFLVSMGLVKAAVWQRNEVTGISRVCLAERSEIKLQLNCEIEPVVSADSETGSIKIDFIGVQANKKLLNKPFSDDFIQLGYLFNYGGAVKAVGLRLFPRKGILKGLRKTHDGFVISVALGKNIQHGPVSQTGHTLLNPSDSKYAPVSLNLSDSPFSPVLLKLAEQAEIDLKFSGSLPERIGLNVEAPNAHDAIKMIAQEAGLRFFQDGKFWRISGEGA